LKSEVGNTSIYLRINNKSDEPVEYKWLNYQGGLVYYGIAQPGHTNKQQTFVTHPWVFFNKSGKQLGAYQPLNLTKDAFVNITIESDSKLNIEENEGKIRPKFMNLQQFPAESKSLWETKMDRKELGKKHGKYFNFKKHDNFINFQQWQHSPPHHMGKGHHRHPPIFF